MQRRLVRLHGSLPEPDAIEALQVPNRIVRARLQARVGVDLALDEAALATYVRCLSTCTSFGGLTASPRDPFWCSLSSTGVLLAA